MRRPTKQKKIQGTQAQRRASKFSEVENIISRKLWHLVTQLSGWSPRKFALENYPETIHVYFSKNDWIEQCTKIKAKDNYPIDRDERRAYFDSVRDIEADKHGYTLIRIKHGDFDWEDTNASAYLDTLLSKTYDQKYSDQMHCERQGIVSQTMLEK